ncbi:MAG: cation-translocating P-type ATPase [Candidatus Obscuribacterales bacterium]|nr:cation-translocating P-type ATPase [Candidatus Obscuribacterales bacterium]
MTEELGKTQEQTYYVRNVDCENEVAKIERELGKQPGVRHVKVSPLTSKVMITFEPERVSSESLAKVLSDLGFPLKESAENEAPEKFWQNKKVLFALISGVTLALGWIGSKLGIAEGFSLALYIASVAIGGYYFGREALEELIHERKINIELLMTVAALTALVLGESAEAAMLVFLYSISEAAEGYTEEKTRAAVRALMKLVPKVALVIRDGVELEIPVEELKVGDIFIVRPGESLATDGEVIAGSSSINEAPVTGESMPVAKSEGSKVFAGSINAEGALDVRATKTFAENTIARIIQMVEEAQERKGKNQRFIEKFGEIYSPLVLVAGIAVAILPPLIFGLAWMTWLTRATVFLVAAAPCALVISIPITLVATLGTAARQGVLIKGGIYVEELGKVQAVALDKTGTITIGRPEVTDFEMVPNTKRSERDILAMSAGIEQRSQHPLAEAVVRYVSQKEIPVNSVSDFQSTSGAGARAVYEGIPVKVGSPQFFGNTVTDDFRKRIEDWQSEGKTVILFGDDNSVWALFAIRDRIRPEAREAIESLRAAGIKHIVMLTGDNNRTAHAIAKEVGIDEVFAELKPDDKVTQIRGLVGKYSGVLMVGDGVNDAPALAEATVGVAMGAVGSDVAIETADVALMADDLRKLAYAIQLAQRNKNVINQNLALSAFVITMLVIGAIAGLLSLPVAVLGHEISEFIVIASGLRMLRS